MATTGRSRGPASRPPRRPAGGRPRASARVAGASAPGAPARTGWRGRLTVAARDRRTRRGLVLLSIMAFLLVLLGSTVAAYVEQQARQRLKFVKPGERSYTVLDPEPSAATKDPVPEVVDEVGPAQPWYATVWGSTQTADAPGARR